MNTTSRSQLLRQFASFAIVGSCIFLFLYLAVPWLRKPLVRENNILDILTTVLFFTTFMYGICVLKKIGLSRCGKRYMIIPLIGFIGFLEELSYGQSFLYYPVPIVNGVKIDALHDWVQVGYHSVVNQSSLMITIILLGCFFVCVLLVWWSRQTLAIRKTIACLRDHPPFDFVIIAFVLILCALVLDLHIFTHHFLVFVEELFETIAGMALVFACVALKRLAEHPHGGVDVKEDAEGLVIDMRKVPPHR